MKVIQINRLFIYYYSFNVFDSKSEKVFDFIFDVSNEESDIGIS